MKKLIAGAAIATMLFATSGSVFAETAPVAPVTTTAVETTTTAAPETTAPVAPDIATTTAVEAEPTVELPAVTIKPDQFFYGLKLWVENIKVAVTRDAIERAALLEQQAQTRLAEAKLMAEAGKMDLAQQALNEAKAKLGEAEKVMASAATANKDISRLATKIDSDQTTFAVVLTKILDKAPAETKEAMEPVVAEMLVQLAVMNETATPDEQAKEEAEKAIEEAKLQKELSALQPRMVLVLKAMAEASGKSLEEVAAMYKAHPGLGVLAKQLNLKMGPVQHAAQMEWKQRGDKIEIEIKSKTAEGESKLELKSDGVKVELKSETKLTAQKEEARKEAKTSKVSKDSDDDDDDDNKGKGNGKDKNKDKNKGKK